MQYRTGNVSVVNGSPTVTGDTSAWLANVSAGDLFKIVGTGAVYQVASVESNTSLTLTSPFAGSTAGGLLYVIVRDFTPNAPPAAHPARRHRDHDDPRRGLQAHRPDGLAYHHHLFSRGRAGASLG